MKRTLLATLLLLVLATGLFQHFQSAISRETAPVEAVRSENPLEDLRETHGSWLPVQSPNHWTAFQRFSGQDRSDTPVSDPHALQQEWTSVVRLFSCKASAAAAVLLPYAFIRLLLYPFHFFW